jgi:glucose-6-phosphate isomerase
MKERLVKKPLLAPFGILLDLEKGAMLKPKRRLVRRASDLRGYYADAEALEAQARRGNPVHYEVEEIPVPETRGNLMYCISRVLPGRVGDEYFMTKGHYHADAGTAEVYLGLRGVGLVLMKTPAGEVRAEKMERGRMVYVPPFWAHRTVNTGREPLSFFCVYPADAGHNYGDIASEGFPCRVLRRAGRPRIVRSRKPR